MKHGLSHRQKLIVTADDFGVSPRANRNIQYLISLGKIDRVSIMAQGIFSKKEIDALLKSGVKIDIHLDVLKEFNENRRKRSGAFLRGFGFVWKIIIRNLSPAKVERDWTEQLEKFREIFGRNPDGINSHEHVHFFPSFMNIALKLGSKNSIPYIRFGENVLQHKNLPSQIIRWLQIINRKKMQASQHVYSETLVSLDWIKDMDNFLDNLPEGKIEIVCHPEIADDFVKMRKYF